MQRTAIGGILNGYRIKGYILTKQQVIKTDVAIIGAGPVGLFAAFQCGMAGLKCHIIDPLDAPGGQCIALYPEKPIYDIPGYPKIMATDLIEKLTQQAAPFAPQYHMGHMASGLEKLTDGGWQLTTSKEAIFNVGAVIIAAGVGAFEPKCPPLDGLEKYERMGPGAGINYFVKNIDAYTNKNVVIAGGGNSAVDWALALVDVAKSVSLVHRRDRFRAHEASLTTLHEFADSGKINLVVPYQLTGLLGDKTALHAVQVEDFDNKTQDLDADVLLAFYGLSQKLGPIADWGLGIENRRIETDPTTAQTNQPGLFAIGDVAVYPHKQRLILTGFSEAAFAAEAARHHIHPKVPLKFQHSTTKGLPAND